MSSILDNDCVANEDVSVLKRLPRGNCMDGKSSLTLRTVCPDTHALYGNTSVKMATVTMVRAYRKERTVIQAASTE
jgi:hypothetical protein